MPNKFKTRLLHAQFIRFLLVGVINTCFGFAVFSALIYFGLHYTIAILLATCAGVLFNFKTIGRYVFNNTNGYLIFRFVMVYLVIYLLNVLLMKLGSYIISNTYINGAIAMVAVAFIGFSLNKYFVFNRVSYEKN